MDLKELGQLLLKQRESLGFSIEDLSENTRISRSILAIFEAGDIDHFPHPVYAKGFIRNYARALNLDEEMCIKALEQGMAPVDDVETDGEKRPSLHDLEEAKPAVPSGSPLLVIFGSVVLIAILAGLIWYYSISGLAGPSGEKAAVETSSATQQVVAENAAEHATDAELGQAEDTVAPQAEVDGGTSTELQSEQHQEVHGQGQGGGAPLSVQASAGEAMAPAASIPASEPVQHSGLHSLVIEVVGKAPCWVGVWIPGQEMIAKDFTIPVNERVEYRFNGNRIVRFGRIETVQLTFDGKPRPVKGRGVVNLTLP